MRQPSRDELLEWQRMAEKRQSLLPVQFAMKGKYVDIVCSNCLNRFERKLLPYRNDPVYVCPNCKQRIYVPVQW
jgi:hypothetical protein